MKIVVLANDIYQREKLKYDTQLAEKDQEIIKLRKYLQGLTSKKIGGRSGNHHKRSSTNTRNMVNDTEVQSVGSMMPKTIQRSNKTKAIPE